MKKILISIIVLGLIATLAAPMAAMAAPTGTVSVTTGASTVSMTVSPGTWSVGTITAGTAYSTFTSGEQGEFTLTNDGNVTEDFTIQGTNASGSTVTWTLSKTLSSANQYSLGFGQATGASYDTECADYTEFDTSGTDTLTTGLVVAGNYLFDIELTTYSGTDVSQVMSATVTITAVES